MPLSRRGRNSSTNNSFNYLIVLVLGFFAGFAINLLHPITTIYDIGDAANIQIKSSPHDDVYRDVCSSRPYGGGMPKRIVEAKAVDISFNMSIYDIGGGIGDIVSRVIAQSKAWEKIETEEMMAVFPCIKGMECKEGGSFTSRRGTLLDVGANIGWYSLVAAHLGHNVISFEPFSNNVDLICSSRQYLKDDHKKNWQLFELGLDYRKRQCMLFQQKGFNIGDTHSICNEKTRDSFIKIKHTQLGWMNTTTLDDALLEGLFDLYPGIDVMKMDVEGFEPSVMAGANRFFESKYAPTYIFIEFTSKTVSYSVGSADARDYMKSILIHMKNHGYELLSRGGGGHAINVSIQNNTLDEVLREVDGGDLIFVHQLQRADFTH